MTPVIGCSVGGDAGDGKTCCSSYSTAEHVAAVGSGVDLGIRVFLDLGIAKSEVEMLTKTASRV